MVGKKDKNKHNVVLVQLVPNALSLFLRLDVLQSFSLQFGHVRGTVSEGRERVHAGELARLRDEHVERCGRTKSSQQGLGAMPIEMSRREREGGGETRRSVGTRGSRSVREDADQHTVSTEVQKESTS